MSDLSQHYTDAANHEAHDISAALSALLDTSAQKKLENLYAVMVEASEQYDENSPEMQEITAMVALNLPFLIEDDSKHLGDEASFANDKSILEHTDNIVTHIRAAFLDKPDTGAPSPAFEA